MQKTLLLEQIEKEAESLILQDKLRLIESLICQIRTNISVSNESDWKEPCQQDAGHLAQAKGWLNEDDDFFQMMDCILQNRDKHIPRILTSYGEYHVSP
ncbi:MAG: hypothetical protein BWK80_55985 [Desulfobacteraceae bacterium IS3]|nr:MAG: hypothetical protein BWK80_55985 [Desulfobacteraceae bacterium IS3]